MKPKAGDRRIEALEQQAGSGEPRWRQCLIAALVTTMAGSTVACSEEGTSLTAERGTACGVDGRVTMVDYAVENRAPLRSAADPKASQMQLYLGTSGELTPVEIDSSMAVRELCHAGEWSEVQVLQLPSDIGRAHGWVPSASLRKVKTTASGRRIYDADDFEWPAGSNRYKTAALTVINRVMAEDPTCDAFNTQSILVEKDRKGVLLKAACFGEPEQIVEFRPADATNGRSFAPVVPVSLDAASFACLAAARKNAVHPSTVDMSIMGATFTPHDDGSASYLTTFTAKNSFNLELQYSIECLFRGNELTFSSVEEA